MKSPFFANVKWLSASQPQRNDPDWLPVPLGFLALIAGGAALLMLPVAPAPGRTLPWIDAFSPPPRRCA